VRLVSEEIVNGRARRSYGLTDDGAAALSAEAEHLARAARVVTGKARRSPAGAVVLQPRPE
jgi:PadR family transcriptional regulator, regulatory protein PadR